MRETEEMMDELIVRMAQRVDAGYKIAASEECRERLKLDEFKSFCELLFSAYDTRCRLEDSGLMTEDDLESFDDKLFALKYIALDLSTCFEDESPEDVLALQICLGYIFPEAGDEY